MDEKNVYNAVKYADSSNTLENNSLEKKEIDKIIEHIKKNRNEKSFLFSILEAIKNRHTKEQSNDKNKTRK